MMPITAITSESRRVETNDGADLASAQPSDQSIETRPCDSPAGRPPHIIIDDFDVHETTLASNFDQIILPPPTFQVRHDLGLRRLAHVDHGFALEHAGWQKISARHRRAPRR